MCLTRTYTAQAQHRHSTGSAAPAPHPHRPVALTITIAITICRPSVCACGHVCRVEPEGEDQPISLDACLASYFEPELMEEGNLYACDTCMATST